MAAYIDRTYIDALLGGTAKRIAMFTPAGGAYVDTDVDVLISAAQGVVDSALSYALEVDVPLTGTVPATVKLATFGQFVLLLHGRKAIPTLEQWITAIGLAEAIRSGKVDLPELQANTDIAIGAITGSDGSDDSTATDAKPLKLAIDKLTGW